MSILSNDSNVSRNVTLTQYFAPIKDKMKLNQLEEDIYRGGKSVEPRAPRRPRLNIYPHVLHEGCHVTVFEMTRRDEGHATRDTFYPSSFLLLPSSSFFFLSLKTRLVLRARGNLSAEPMSSACKNEYNTTTTFLRKIEI